MEDLGEDSPKKVVFNVPNTCRCCNKTVFVEGDQNDEKNSPQLRPIAPKNNTSAPRCLPESEKFQVGPASEAVNNSTWLQWM